MIRREGGKEAGDKVGGLIRREDGKEACNKEGG